MGKNGVTTKYEVRKNSIEVRRKEREEIKAGISLTGADQEPEIIRSCDTAEEAREELKNYNSSIKEFSASAGKYYTVEEYYIEENSYDEEGEWISGGDVLVFADFKEYVPITEFKVGDILLLRNAESILQNEQFHIAEEQEIEWSNVERKYNALSVKAELNEYKAHDVNYDFSFTIKDIDGVIREGITYVIDAGKNDLQQSDSYNLGNYEFDEDGYLHFSIDVDGYQLEGLYRVNDPDYSKEENHKLISIDYGYLHPIIQEKWDEIEKRITDSIGIRYYTKNLGGTGQSEDTQIIRHPDFSSALTAYLEAVADGKEIGYAIGNKEFQLAYFSTTVMKNIYHSYTYGDFSDLSANEIVELDDNYQLMVRELRRDNTYNDMVQGFEAIAMNRAMVGMIRSNDEWGTWLGRIANAHRPQDYVDVDITGYRRQHEVTCEVKVVHANDVVHAKSISFQTDLENFEKSVRDGFVTIRSEFLEYFKGTAIEMLDTDEEYAMITYATDMEHTLEEHYERLGNLGYDEFPNMDYFAKEKVEIEYNEILDAYEVKGISFPYREEYSDKYLKNLCTAIKKWENDKLYGLTDEEIVNLAKFEARYVDVDKVAEEFVLGKEAFLQAVKKEAGVIDFIELARWDYIVLDTETTGFAKDDEIIELGITDKEGNVLYEGMFKPFKELSTEASAINGITLEDLEDKPSFDNEFEKIVEIIANRPLVIYNKGFDTRMMLQTAKIHNRSDESYQNAIQSLEKHFNEKTFCAMQSYAEYKQFYKVTSLVDALKEQGVEKIQSHRAVDDCRDTLNLIYAVQKNVTKHLVRDFRTATYRKFHEIDGLTAFDMEMAVREYIEEAIKKNDIQAEIVDVVLYGSRARGLEKADSDIDFVVEYKGQIREDVLFDILHEDSPLINSIPIPVDINPIRAEETGTLEEYLPKAETYLEVKELAIIMDEAMWDIDPFGYHDAVDNLQDESENLVQFITEQILDGKAQSYIDEFTDNLEGEDEPEKQELYRNIVEKLKQFDFKKRLFVDIDGTLAEFKTVDTLETLYEEGYFFNLEPHENVVDAVKEIMTNHPEVEVFIMSSVLSDSKYALAEKNAWLDKYLPEIDMEHRIYPPCRDNKLDYVPGGIRETDHLLDDYTKNLVLWQPPAKGIKLLNGINHTHSTWTDNRLDIQKDAKTLVNDIVSIMNGNQIMDLSPQESQDIDDMITSVVEMEFSDILAKQAELAEQISALHRALDGSSGNAKMRDKSERVDEILQINSIYSYNAIQIEVDNRVLSKSDISINERFRKYSTEELKEALDKLNASQKALNEAPEITQNLRTKM